MGEATDMERGKMDIIKDNYKKNRFKIPRVSRYDIRRALKIATFASLGVLTIPKDVVFVESEQIETTSRMRNIDFQVDTLAHNTGAGGYFASSNNSITLNYLENDENFNKWSTSKAVITHEQKHRDNYNQGMYVYAMSVEQAYKVCMHDEISACMASLIYLRDEYLKTGDISVFNEDGSRFSFYVDAIKNGEINPFSNSKEDFDKEMSLIVNGTRDMWVKTYASNNYLNAHITKAKYYGEEDGTHAEFYDQNYERAKKIAYTIGGVDFTEYMDKDVEVPKQAKRKIMTSDNMVEHLGLPEYDGNMSLLQYQKLLQHALVMSDKEIGINSEDHILSGLAIAGKWNLNRLARLHLLNRFAPSDLEMYKEALDNIAKEDKKLIDGVIIGIAKDYEKRGEKLPEDNDKAYNDAVNKLYTGHVNFDYDYLKYDGEINLRNVFNPHDELPLKELPQKTQESQQQFENMGMWERALAQYANFFGEDLRGGRFEYMSGLPDIVRYPLEAWGGYVGIPIVAAGRKCIEFVEDCIDTVKDWLGIKEDKNEQIRPVKEDNTPQYEEWSKDKRVSPVQNAQILNLMADVIEKPSNNNEENSVDEFFGRSFKVDREKLKNDTSNATREEANMIKIAEGLERIDRAKNVLKNNKAINDDNVSHDVDMNLHNKDGARKIDTILINKER